MADEVVPSLQVVGPFAGAAGAAAGAAAAVVVDVWSAFWTPPWPLHAPLPVALEVVVVLARLRGLRPTRLDRLVGCFMYFDDPAAGDRELIIEASRDGWWYTAALPAGRRVAAFMTDADLARGLEIGQREPWLCQLGETDYIAACTARAQPLGPIHLHGAGSQILTDDSAQSMLGIGDAAACFDPVSGQGIVKALRSAIFASYAIGDWLERNDPGGLQRYRAFIKAEFAAYHQTLHQYYAGERRWPASAFWQRRHASSAPPRQRQAASAMVATAPL